MDEKKNNFEFSERIYSILEEHGFGYSDLEVNGNRENEFSFDIYQSTPLGEDWHETFVFDILKDDLGNTKALDDAFIKEVGERFLNFDVDEEAEIWVDLRGSNGVPNSISALVDDARWKENTLKELSEAFGSEDTYSLYTYSGKDETWERKLVCKAGSLGEIFTKANTIHLDSARAKGAIWGLSIEREENEFFNLLALPTHPVRGQNTIILRKIIDYDFVTYNENIMLDDFAEEYCKKHEAQHSWK